MLTEEDHVEIHVLNRQGMTVSEIARRTGHDRKTVRGYLREGRVPGRRERSGPDLFDPFVVYVRARLVEDPHLWAVTLFHELTGLGFTQSYATLTRQIRDRRLRPVCEACAHVTERANAVIPHPPGEETQFDWLELPDPPSGWVYPTKKAYLLVGSLAHSGCWRAVLSPSMDTPHLLTSISDVVEQLGGVTRVWRFDRMRTVLDPNKRDLTPTFAGFAKHYGVRPVVCRPRAGNRKGVVEKNNHTAAQRWWRTLPDELTPEQAQASVTTFATSQDNRARADVDGTTTAKAMRGNEHLQPLPVMAFPVTVIEERTATRQALIQWRGNKYSVPPELAASKVLVQQKHKAQVIEITTLSGIVIAKHQVASPGLGVTTRDTGHVTALDHIAKTATAPGKPHRRKERIPPGPTARAAADQLRGTEHTATITDLAAYETAAKNRNTLK